MHQCLTTPETHLRGDNDILAARPERCRQEFLRLTAGVNIRGIEMVYAGVEGFRDKFIGELLIYFRYTFKDGAFRRSERHRAESHA